MNKNNRTQKRFVDKTIEVCFNYENKLIKGQSLNISSFGICVLFSEKVDNAVIGNLVLKFVYNNEKVEENVVSKVIWISDLGNEEFLVGMSYLDTNNLNKYIEYLNLLEQNELKEDTEE